MWAAALKKPSFLGLAVVPICFGIQQISEGFVWHTLEHGGSNQTRTPSLVFLFFALAFWPWWFSVVTKQIPFPVASNMLTSFAG